LSTYCPFHGTRLREYASPLVHLSETAYRGRERTARHAHLETTLAFVVSGGFHERQGSRVVECGPAGLLLRPAGVEHEDAFGDHGTACFNVEVGADLVGDRPLPGANAKGGRAEWLAMRLLLELREGPPWEPVSIEGQVADLLDALAARPSGSIPDRVTKVLSLLKDGFAERWSLRSLAREAGVHPMHLARMFRRHCGESVGQALHRVRVEHACRMLVETSRPLADVATASGFADQAHLTRVFRKQTGVTPGRYRSALRGDRRFRSFKT
jgi:AraC family transcriptional regulator